MKTQIVNNSSGDSLHSVFFISEKEAQLNSRESMLQLWQEELVGRADEISQILKTFGHSGRHMASYNLPLQMKSSPNTIEPSNNLHVDSLCDLPV